MTGDILLDNNVLIQLEKAKTDIEEYYNSYAKKLMSEINKNFPPIFEQEKDLCTYIIIPRYTDFIPLDNTKIMITLGEENEN